MSKAVTWMTFEQASLVVFTAADVPGLSHDWHGWPQANQHHEATPFLHKTTALIWPNDVHWKDTCQVHNKTPFPGRAMKETNVSYVEEEVSDSDGVNQLEGLGAADELPTLSKRRPAEMIEFTAKIKDGSKHQVGHGNKQPEVRLKPSLKQGGQTWINPGHAKQDVAQPHSATARYGFQIRTEAIGGEWWRWNDGGHLEIPSVQAAMVMSGCSHGWVLNIDIWSGNSFQHVKLFSIHPLWQTKFPMEYTSIPEFIFGKSKPGGRTLCNLQAPQGGVKRCQSTFHLNHGFLRFPHQWLIHFHPPCCLLTMTFHHHPPLPPDDDIPPPPPPPNNLEDMAEEVPLPQPSEASDDSEEQTPLPQSDEDETDNALIPPPPPSLQESDSHHSVTSPDGNDTHMSTMDMDISSELPLQPPSDSHDLTDEEKWEMEVHGFMDLHEEAEGSLCQIADLDNFYDPFTAIGLQQFAAQPQYLAQQSVMDMIFMYMGCCIDTAIQHLQIGIAISALICGLPTCRKMAGFLVTGQVPHQGWPPWDIGIIGGELQEQCMQSRGTSP
ncbi:hypothetical protein F5J12DRAFT_784634 [Pisolithus orientalis]|uniref:uncharacterized protein n=1 Tax=Pisolithus orientalis TaxID=936130 RepID=UPI002224DB14|nr:uncharacterized protein F5J12DRAFT_784634 [Pisolithus orientalis]KAI5999878.1 hypothetical protein F5J12DRAFT_784634 [Pisolithus orientalis]